MRFDVREIASIALVAALTIVVGFVFYTAGNLLPVPGNKFLMFGPFLGFMIAMALWKVPRHGTVLAVNGVFALIMVNISAFMGLAIALAGIFWELLSLILFRDLKKKRIRMGAAALYPALSFFFAFLVSHYMTGNVLFLMVGGPLTLGILMVVIFLLGLAGAFLGERFIVPRLEGITR